MHIYLCIYLSIQICLISCQLVVSSFLIACFLVSSSIPCGFVSFIKCYSFIQFSVHLFLCSFIYSDIHFRTLYRISTSASDLQIVQNFQLSVVFKELLISTFCLAVCSFNLFILHIPLFVREIVGAEVRKSAEADHPYRYDRRVISLHCPYFHAQKQVLFFRRLNYAMMRTQTPFIQY